MLSKSVSMCNRALVSILRFYSNQKGKLKDDVNFV